MPFDVDKLQVAVASDVKASPDSLEACVGTHFATHGESIPDMTGLQPRSSRAAVHRLVNLTLALPSAPQALPFFEGRIFRKPLALW